jgi:hypothetical protein
MRYIGYFLAAVFVVGSVLTYVGFRSLQDLAIGTAKDAMKQETSKEVDRILTQNEITKNVKEQVKDQVKEVTVQEARVQLKEEIEKGPLHREILDTAAKQSQEMITQNVGERYISAADQQKIADAIKAQSLLSATSVKIVIGFAPNSEEAYGYSEMIRKAINDARGVLTRQRSAPFARSEVALEYGVVISYRTLYRDATGIQVKQANALKAALAAGGVPSRVTDEVLWGDESGFAPMIPNTQTLNLFVGRIKRPILQK